MSAHIAASRELQRQQSLAKRGLLSRNVQLEHATQADD